MDYQSNGVLPYDDIRGGFGHLDRHTYQKRMMGACALLKKKPELKTVEYFIEKDIQSLQKIDEGSAPKGKKTLSFSIDESALVFRLILFMESSDGGIPFAMSVVGPTGAVVRLNPATVNGKRPAWGLAATNGFFATDSKGVWKIILHERKGITRLKVKISAVQKGSLVEHIVQDSIEEERKLTPTFFHGVFRFKSI